MASAVRPPRWGLPGGRLHPLGSPHCRQGQAAIGSKRPSRGRSQGDAWRGSCGGQRGGMGAGGCIMAPGSSAGPSTKGRARGVGAWPASAGERVKACGGQEEGWPGRGRKEAEEERRGERRAGSILPGGPFPPVGWGRSSGNRRGWERGGGLGSAPVGRAARICCSPGAVPQKPACGPKTLPGATPGYLGGGQDPQSQVLGTGTHGEGKAGWHRMVPPQNGLRHGSGGSSSMPP